MTQYDAGPGDWSDREWEAPDRKPEPHVKRRRIVLPPWALLAGLVAIVILSCVGLVIAVRAIRGGRAERATPPAAAAEGASPTEEAAIVTLPTDSTPPTPTIPIPTIMVTDQLPDATEITVGAKVVVQGTRGAGLNVRAEPSTAARLVTTVKEGAVLTVLGGPEEADGFTWWNIRTADGKDGWGAAQWLVLQAQ